MKVYTSSYYRYRGNRGVQISNSRPDDSTVSRALPELYPTWANINAWNKVRKLPMDSPRRIRAWQKYTDDYWSKLNRIGPERILSLLSDGDVLLGWCGKASECSRSILAEWLSRNGVEVEEL